MYSYYLLVLLNKLNIWIYKILIQIIIRIKTFLFFVRHNLILHFIFVRKLAHITTVFKLLRCDIWSTYLWSRWVLINLNIEKFHTQFFCGIMLWATSRIEKCKPPHPTWSTFWFPWFFHVFNVFSWRVTRNIYMLI